MNKLKVIIPVILGIIAISFVVVKSKDFSESNRMKRAEQIDQLALDKNNEKIMLSVKNATCASCFPSVEKALKNVAGVKAALVLGMKPEGAETAIICEKGKVTPAHLIAALEQASYKASLL